jgi:phage replication O-like protein O
MDEDKMTIIKPFARQGNFTVFDNAILDHIMPEVSNTAWKVLCFVIRKTIGWQKDQDGLALSQIGIGTGIKSNTTLSKAITDLEDMSLIIVTRYGDGTTPNTYSINRNYEIDNLCPENGQVGVQKMDNPYPENGHTKETIKTKEQIGATPAGKPKNHQLPELDEQQKDELMFFGIHGGGGKHHKQSINEPEYQARQDIESVWKKRMADDTKAALILLLVAIRAKSPGFDPPADDSGQGAWGKGARDHLANYSLDELRRFYPKAVAHNSAHDLSYFKPQSLSDTMNRIKHGTFGENGNYNTVTSTGAVRIL